MTEAVWLAETTPWMLLDYVRHSATERKLRLFACACCRRIWKHLDDDACRAAVDVAEKFADGQESTAALDAAYHLSSQATTAANKSAVWTAEASFGVSLAAEVCVCATDAVSLNANDLGKTYLAESREQAGICRDIFGNPFRPVAVDPAWRTEAVVALAAGVYADRAFERLPVLADALDDAGCANADLLSHCRAPGPHVRGCWVVDLLLGKT